MSMNLSTVSTKGQTTIPEELRKEFSIQPGQRLLWESIGGKLVATPAGDLMDLAGALKSDKPYLSKKALRETLRAARAKHFSRKLSGS